MSRVELQEIAREFYDAPGTIELSTCYERATVGGLPAGPKVGEFIYEWKGGSVARVHLEFFERLLDAAPYLEFAIEWLAFDFDGRFWYVRKVGARDIFGRIEE